MIYFLNISRSNAAAPTDNPRTELLPLRNLVKGKCTRLNAYPLLICRIPGTARIGVDHKVLAELSALHQGGNELWSCTIDANTYAIG